MAYPVDDRCSSCRYYRLTRTNALALRWAALIISTAIPLMAGYADIWVPGWQISTTYAGFYATGVLGLVLIAYQPRLYSAIAGRNETDA